jgi:ATP-dependent RNA helicase SUPV3L1/SUV3
MSAKSGVYCGPLKMLAVEICNKTNARGIPCDLITGDNRKYAREDKEPSDHIACTVEMTNVTNTYEVGSYGSQLSVLVYLV